VNPLAPVPFSTWANVIADPVQRMPMATPMGDGVPNLVKYVVGIPATQRAVEGNLPSINQTAGGMVFRFHRDRSATGVSAVVEKSTTLADGSWTPLSAVKVDDDGAIETWEAPVADEDLRAFYHLNVSTTTDTAPIISAQPTSVSVTVGATPTLNVGVTGTGPFTYQWRKNGVAIAGATGSSYLPPAVTAADHGARYTVLVTGAAGTAASVEAVVAVAAGASSTTYTPLTMLPELDGGPAGTWANASNFFVKDKVGGDLVGVFSGSNQGSTTHAVAVVSRDEGRTWTVLRPNPAFGLPSTGAMCQSADGKIHVLCRALSNEGMGYARLNLVRDTAGHVVNFTSDLPMRTNENYPQVMLPDVNANRDIRNDIVAGYDKAGSPRLFWILYDDPSDNPVRGRVFAGMSSVAAGWNPTSPADWVSLTNQPGITVLKQFAEGGSSHTSTAHLTQHPISRDLWIEWGPLNTCDSSSDNTVPIERLRCTPTADHAWSVGTPVVAGAYSTSAGWACLLGSIVATPTHVWFTRVDGATGIHIDKVDKDGQVTVDAIPVPWGGPQCGADMAFSVNAAGTQAWLGLWVPYDSAVEPNAVFAMHWDGSTWTRYNDLDVDDTAGVSQSIGWDNGLVMAIPLWEGGWRVRVASIRTSGGAVVTAPAIVAHPEACSVVAGQTATFSVTAAGSAPLHYQWRKNGIVIAGAPDAADYTTPLNTLDDHGASYTVVVTNSFGGEVSEPALLSVSVPPPLPVIASFVASPTTITSGQSSTLSWNVTGATSLSLNQGIGVVTGTSRSVSPAATTTYTLTATNAGGSTTKMTTVNVSGGLAGVAALVAQVSGERYSTNLRDHLFTHLGDSRGAAAGYVPSAQHEMVRELLKSHFTAYGLTVTEQETRVSGFFNVIGEKRGTTRPDDIIIVGGHYDSVGNPGANDNATGTAAIMEAVQVLSGQSFEATIRFIAFDLEEGGLIGSKDYVAAHPDANIIFMLNVDTIGQDGGNHRLAIDSPGAETMKAALADAMIRHSGGVVPVVRTTGDLSDHLAFHDAGFTAFEVYNDDWWTQGDPYNHTANDSVDTPGYINDAFATMVTRGVVGFLAEQAVLVTAP
jgi:hypothetical protein